MRNKSLAIENAGGHKAGMARRVTACAASYSLLFAGIPVDFCRLQKNAALFRPLE